MATNDPSADPKEPSGQEVNHAVFIVNKDPKGWGRTNFIPRKGANADLDNMQEVFIQKLGFRWLNLAPHQHYNLALDEWDHNENNDSSDSDYSDENEETSESDNNESSGSDNSCKNKENDIGINCCECLLCLIKAADHSKSKYFLLAISTHGRQNEDSEDHIKFSDGNGLSTHKILEALDDDHCPVLKGKTRIVFFGACRTNAADPENCEDTGATIYVIPKQTEKRKSTGAAERIKRINEASFNNEDEDEAYLIPTEENDLPLDMVVSSSNNESESLHESDSGVVLGEAESDVGQGNNPSSAGHSNIEDESSVSTIVRNGATGNQQNQVASQKKSMSDIPLDFLVVYSSTTGKRTKRGTTLGIWMFQCLTIVMKEYNFEKRGALNFQKALTRANSFMSHMETKVYKKDENGKQMKDEDGKVVIDETSSGLKSSMCVHQNLTDLVLLDPKVQQPHGVNRPSVLFPGMKKKIKVKKVKSKVNISYKIIRQVKDKDGNEIDENKSSFNSSSSVQSSKKYPSLFDPKILHSHKDIPRIDNPVKELYPGMNKQKKMEMAKTEVDQTDSINQQLPDQAPADVFEEDKLIIVLDKEASNPFVGMKKKKKGRKIIDLDKL